MPQLVPSNYAIENSENDIKRSNSIFNFLQNKLKIDSTNSLIHTTPIPKTIIQFWDKEDIPNDVKTCMESWNLLNKEGYRYILFNDKSAREYISSNLNKKYLLAFDNCYHPAMKSDYFRLCYIKYSGGMYVDSDELYSGLNIDNYFINSKLKLQPLCYDLKSNQMIEKKQFLNNDIQNKHWVYYFNNNPIISAPFNPIISYALERATNILLNIDFDNLPEIQSTAGPGNITASIVAAHLTPTFNNEIEILTDWEKLSKTIWFLSYRNDSRNWRISNCKSFN